MTTQLYSAGRTMGVSVGTALVLATACRDRRDCRNMVKCSTGVLVVAVCARGIPNWFRGRSFLSYNHVMTALNVAAAAPVLYASRCTLVSSRPMRALEAQAVPRSLLRSPFYTYVQTSLATSLGAVCISFAAGFGWHVIPVYTVLGCGLAHYAWDAARILLTGRYRKQVLRLHFPNISDELDMELEIAQLPAPYFTYWSKRYDDTRHVHERLGHEMAALEREVHLYRTMQEEAYRLRAELYGETPGDGGGDAGQAGNEP